MKIKTLEIDGFRCLCDLKLIFEDTLTLIVGENDSGKSSLIDCLNLFTEDYSLDLEDFNYEKDTITLKLAAEDFEFIKEFKKAEFPSSILTVKPSTSFIASAKAFIDGLSNTNTPEQEARIKELATTFGIIVRSNSKMDTLISQLSPQLSDSNVVISNGRFPDLNKIQLNGKQFEDVESFFKEVFIKDKQIEIWHTKIREDKTIKEFIQEELDNYSTLISEELESKGIKKKLKQYLKQLTDIKVEPLFEPNSSNISSKVKFLEGGNEISVNKKGDGTKRRISLALLEYKAECEEGDRGSKLYILDEPDTHLHVKAQLELLKVLRELSEKGCQVILTTHSPFLINAIKPKQVRLLFQPDSNVTKQKFLQNEPETSDKILRQLGIENIYLYFAKKIILVEGETEEAFLPRIYEKINNTTLNSDLIKIINTRGIKNIPGFVRALLDLVNPNSIYIMKDNDASAETIQLINDLSIPDERQFSIGQKEFEDSFSDEIIYNSWKSYIEECGKTIGSNWILNNISNVKQECLTDLTKKFSEELKTLNAGCGKKFSKIIFGRVLGDFCNTSNLPIRINELLINLRRDDNE